MYSTTPKTQKSSSKGSSKKNPNITNNLRTNGLIASDRIDAKQRPHTACARIDAHVSVKLCMAGLVSQRAVERAILALKELHNTCATSFATVISNAWKRYRRREITYSHMCALIRRDFNAPCAPLTRQCDQDAGLTFSAAGVSASIPSGLSVASSVLMCMLICSIAPEIMAQVYDPLIMPFDIDYCMTNWPNSFSKLCIGKVDPLASAGTLNITSNYNGNNVTWYLTFNVDSEDYCVTISTLNAGSVNGSISVGIANPCYQDMLLVYIST